MSRFLFLLLGWIFIATAPLRADAVEALLAQAAAAEERLETQRALDLYLEADRLRPDDARILQKIAQQLSDLTLLIGDDAQIREQTRRALDYAKRAVKLEPNNALNVLSLAVCYGKIGVYSETRAKVRYSRLVKQEAERAVALDPNLDWAHHVLGRWHHEVAELGFTTRFFVRLIYGGLPGASREKAITHLKKAVELAPERVPHHLELGIAYLAAGKKDEARRCFERGLALPSKERYDEPAKTRAREAMKKL
jgi:tetratricopeptide (TPR) repeat protein